MSRILQRKHLTFSNQAALKSPTNFSPILAVALQGTTSTMPSLGGSAPATWKTGLSAPTEAKLDALWAALSTLRTQIVEHNLHYHPSTITPVSGMFGSNITLGTYLRPGYDQLQKRSLLLAKGTRLYNPAGVTVLGGNPMAGLEAGDGVTPANNVYIAQSFLGLLGDTNLEMYFTALSNQVAGLLQALEENQLLCTA